jgi:hypothetical protein
MRLVEILLGRSLSTGQKDSEGQEESGELHCSDFCRGRQRFNCVTRAVASLEQEGHTCELDPVKTKRCQVSSKTS